MHHNDDFWIRHLRRRFPEASLAQQNGVDATLVGAYKSLIGWTANWNEAAWGTAPSNWAFNTIGWRTQRIWAWWPGRNLIFELFQWNPANGIIRSKWIATYEGIVRSNAAITTATDFLKVAPDQTDYVNRIKGEATFLEVASILKHIKCGVKFHYTKQIKNSPKEWCWSTASYHQRLWSCSGFITCCAISGWSCWQSCCILHTSVKPSYKQGLQRCKGCFRCCDSNRAFWFSGLLLWQFQRSRR